LVNKEYHNSKTEKLGPLESMLKNVHAQKKGK